MARFVFLRLLFYLMPRIDSLSLVFYLKPRFVFFVRLIFCLQAKSVAAQKPLKIASSRPDDVWKKVNSEQGEEGEAPASSESAEQGSKSDSTASSGQGQCG
jgi:hypothetical protein